MCWTITIGTGKSACSCGSMTDSALGPPVEAPIATISIGRSATGRCIRIDPSCTIGFAVVEVDRASGGRVVRERATGGAAGTLGTAVVTVGTDAVGTVVITVGTDAVVTARGG